MGAGDPANDNGWPAFNGNFADVFNWNSCMCCMPGTFRFGSICVNPCSTGTYSIRCLTCPANSYCPSNFPILGAPIPCPIGYTLPPGSNASYQCVPCSAGTNQSNGVCVTCPVNSYCTLASFSPIACPSGSYANIGSADPNPCTYPTPISPYFISNFGFIVNLQSSCALNGQFPNANSVCTCSAGTYLASPQISHYNSVCSQYTLSAVANYALWAACGGWANPALGSSEWTRVLAPGAFAILNLNQIQTFLG